MGAERVIFGSDWPHMEGLADPKGILAEIESLGEDSQTRFLYENTSGLNERRPN
jgi:predicted TIM-barrel fold metal-dependent hydrolase